MLTSIVLQLQATSDKLLPAHLGHSNYSAALRLLDSATPGMGDQIHTISGTKPLTCSALFSGGKSSKLRYRRGMAAVRAGEPYWVRLTGLTEEVSATLVEACLGQRPTVWEVARYPFEIVGAVCQQSVHEWSGNTSYQDLATAHLLDSPAVSDKGKRLRMNKVSLQFHSATAFKSNELQVAVPMPRLLFGGLLERWNRYSPVEMRAEMRAFGTYAVELSHFDLKSTRVEPKKGAWRVGAVGEATYIAKESDRYWLGLMQLLADFAFYSGVGVQTTKGMGQVRRSVGCKS